MKKHILCDYNIIEPLEGVDIIATACRLSDIGAGQEKNLFI